MAHIGKKHMFLEYLTMPRYQHFWGPMLMMLGLAMPSGVRRYTLPIGPDPRNLGDRKMSLCFTKLLQSPGQAGGHVSQGANMRVALR